MRAPMLSVIREILDQPIYVIQEGDIAIHVDKLQEKEGKWTRNRYIVSYKKQCTCMGFMKTERCKHLRMVAQEFEGTGVSNHAAAAEVQRLMKLIEEKLFEDKRGEWPIDPEKLPERVKRVELSVCGAKKQTATVVSLKKIGSGTLAVVFLVSG